MSRLRANQITNENANGAPNFPHGLTVTGIITATNNQTTFNNIVVGSAVTANSQGIDVTGVVTATSFKGDGTNLTGVDPSATASSSGFLKVLNASTPQIRLNNDASDGATTRAFFGIATGNNNFVNGSVANDTVLSARAGGDLLVGCGSTIKMKIDEAGTLYNTGGYGSLKEGYLIRAWLNYDSVNSTINGSKHVSSVTNNGNGRYVINWSFNFPDDNYAVTATCGGDGGSVGDESYVSFEGSDFSVGSVSVRHADADGTSLPAHHTSFIAVR